MKRKKGLIKMKKLTNKKFMAGSFAGMLAMMPVTAFADAGDANSVFHEVCGKLSTGISIVGVALVIYGLVQIGLGIKGDGGGQEVKTGLGFLAGGLIIAAAGIIFGTWSSSVSI